MSAASSDNPSTAQRLAIAALMTAAIAALAFGAYLAFDYNHQTARRSTLAPPQTLAVPPEPTLLAGLAARERNQLQEQLRVRPTIWSGDREAAAQHIYNIAAQRGWHPHSLNSMGLQLVLSEEDLPLLHQLEQDPYGWIKNHRNDHAPPTPQLSLGDEELQARISFGRHHHKRATLALLGGSAASLGAIFLSCALFANLTWLTNSSRPCHQPPTSHQKQDSTV